MATVVIVIQDGAEDLVDVAIHQEPRISIREGVHTNAQRAAVAALQAIDAKLSIIGAKHKHQRGKT